MKKNYLVIIGVVFSNLLFCQFAGISLNDVYSTDSSSAWVVGESGTIIHVVDGGMYWEDQSYDTDLSLNSIQFIEEQKGFIVGDSGILLKTDDGGITWDAIDLGVSYDFESIAFVDNQYGWISAYPSLFSGNGLFRTEDGGEDWVHIETEVVYPFFLDSLYGWGSPSSIGGIFVCRTYDGGFSWDTLSYQVSMSIPFFFFYDETNGFMNKSYFDLTTCYNTHDGGVEWTSNGTQIEVSYLSDRLFLDTLNGWLSGHSNVFYSNDYFNSYEVFNQPYDVFNALSIHGASNGWAVSYNLQNTNSTIWRLEGVNNWIPIETIGVDELTSYSEIKSYPNPFTTSTTIKYELTEPSHIQLTIYNTIGETIYVAQDGIKQQGKHTFTWSPESLPEGLYYGVLRSEEGVSVVKIIKQ
ncbi:MAG: hypothetical protein DRI97_08470 [Bacteroidetes bacterium]|nr:MAG: hypothetical protein DRI97_08470 [Bacteroidota bacterium]